MKNTAKIRGFWQLCNQLNQNLIFSSLFAVFQNELSIKVVNFICLEHNLIAGAKQKAARTQRRASADAQ